VRVAHRPPTCRGSDARGEARRELVTQRVMFHGHAVCWVLGETSRRPGSARRPSRLRSNRCASSPCARTIAEESSRAPGPVGRGASRGAGARPEDDKRRVRVAARSTLLETHAAWRVDERDRSRQGAVPSTPSEDPGDRFSKAYIFVLQYHCSGIMKNDRRQGCASVIASKSAEFYSSTRPIGFCSSFAAAARRKLDILIGIGIEAQ